MTLLGMNIHRNHSRRGGDERRRTVRTSERVCSQRRHHGTSKPCAVPVADPDSTVQLNKDGGFAPNDTPVATTEGRGGFIADATVLAGAEDPAQTVETQVDASQRGASRRVGGDQGIKAPGSTLRPRHPGHSRKSTQNAAVNRHRPIPRPGLDRPARTFTRPRLNRQALKPWPNTQQLRPKTPILTPFEAVPCSLHLRPGSGRCSRCRRGAYGTTGRTGGTSGCGRRGTARCDGPSPRGRRGGR